VVLEVLLGALHSQKAWKWFADGAALILCFLIGGSASAQSGHPVCVDLSLIDGKTSYQTGEPIKLNLAFTASEPGYSLNATTTNPASPVDTFVLSPMDGVFPWLDDRARGHRYAPDYASIVTLEANKTATVGLLLNALYRFDAPGHYEVHVVTNRVSSGDLLHSQPLGLLTSNEVEFDVTAVSDADERQKAAELEKQIRETSDSGEAHLLAEDLGFLAGDAATRAKISLYLHPKTFYPFSVDVSNGLWTARNRALVVAELERSLRDSASPVSSGLLDLTAQLKARILVPFDPVAPDKALPIEQLKDEYLHQIAATFPQRTGGSLVGTAQTVFVALAPRREASDNDFAAAREVVITHFGQVNEYSVDWLLNSYGRYLKDPRIVPALENILQMQNDPVFTGERAAVLRHLIEVAPENVRPIVVQEVCAPQSAGLDAVRNAPFDILPETNECLWKRIHAASTSSERRARIDLDQGTAFAARFATKAIYDDLFALYEESGADWNGEARGGMLAYLMRWDAQRARPLLDKALPMSAERFEANISFALFRAYYSPGLDTFLHDRLEKGPPGQAAEAAYQMSEHGPAADRDILRARLDRWRTKWSDKQIPKEQAMLESELVQALVAGKEWQMSDAQASALRESCISSVCRSRFQARQ
jgi:hypothetical protein